MRELVISVLFVVTSAIIIAGVYILLWGFPDTNRVKKDCPAGMVRIYENHLSGKTSTYDWVGCRVL